MKSVTLPSGETVAALGQGTWYLGDDPGTRAEEIAALQRGIDLGATLIDSAEMYGEGRAEELVGEAIAGRRDQVFLVSKVYPHNASRRGAVDACERSLKRLGTDRIDLYLLHWRGGVPLAETVAAFEGLKRDGKIRHWGVSNLDLGDMRELCQVDGGAHVATNQLLFNLSRRGIEWELLPWLRERNVPVMAYSPIEQGRIVGNPKLKQLAQEAGMTAAQVALAWLLAKDGVIAIPKAANRKHVEENVHASERTLSDSQLAALDEIFPPPKRARPLEVL